MTGQREGFQRVTGQGALIIKQWCRSGCSHYWAGVRANTAGHKNTASIFYSRNEKRPSFLLDPLWGEQPPLLHHLRLLTAPRALRAPGRDGGQSAEFLSFLAARPSLPSTPACERASECHAGGESKNAEGTKASLNAASHGRRSAWIHSSTSKGQTLVWNE